MIPPYITNFERMLIFKLFKLEKGEILFNNRLTALLGTRSGVSVDQESNPMSLFRKLSEAPVPLTNLIKKNDEVQIRNELLGLTRYSPTFEQVLTYELNRIFQSEERESEYAHYYAEIDQFSMDTISLLARTHAVLNLIFPLYRDTAKLNITYEMLKPYQHFTVLKMSSISSFRKYIERKEKATLPDGLIHGHIDKPSNNRSLSDFMKDVLIQLATLSIIKKSSSHIKTELDNLISKLGDNADNKGIYSLSVSKIANFLATPEADNRIKFALAEPVVFNRKVLGLHSFLRASAPMVKVNVDAYLYQIKYHEEDNNTLEQFVGVHFHDDFSDFVPSVNLSTSENSKSFLKAFEGFFIATKGALPRILSMDGFTYKILMKCQKVMNLLERNGVKIDVSPNANNKSSLERLFLSVQQKDLPKSIYYIGPGIKSKKPLTHPAKVFKIVLAQKNNALSEYELNRLLKYLVKISHNKNNVGHDIYTPEGRWLEVEMNPVTRLDVNQWLPYLCFEQHTVGVEGGTIRISKKMPEVPKGIRPPSEGIRDRNIRDEIYRNRDSDFLDKFNGVRVDAYINVDDPLIAHIYQIDTWNKVAEMTLYKRFPNNDFDRSEEDVKRKREFDMQSAKNRAKYETDAKVRSERISEKLGFDITSITEQELTTSEFKKMSVRHQIGLDENEKSINKSQLFHANKSRRKRRLADNEDDLGLDVQDTF